MSFLENALFSCGILHPIQSMLNKQKDINIWNIQMISLSEFANKTGTVLQFKAAIRRKHRAIHTQDENQCAQRCSSPESGADTIEEQPNGSSFRIPGHLINFFF